jgi:hypothetical protein
LNENGICVIKWSPASTDLNIIENLWALIKDKLQKSEPKTFEEWVQEIQKIWDNLDPDLLKSLFGSLKNRIEKCIEAKGVTV